jgi:hypothetical protein
MKKKKRRKKKMSIKRETPCDFGPCPYDAEYSHDCEWWCGAEEPQDDFDEEFYDDDCEEAESDYENELREYDLEMGYDPYMGCYSDDC